MNEMHSVTEIEAFPCGFRLGNRQMILEMIWCCFTTATAQMKNGGECDLVVCLCEEKELGLDKADLLELLQPVRYIGRCENQYIYGSRVDRRFRP